MLNLLAVTEEGEIAPDQVYPALGAFAALAQYSGDVAHMSPTPFAVYRGLPTTNYLLPTTS
jgi:hypothetical protein